MPAPATTRLDQLTREAFANAGLEGEGIPALCEAAAELFAQVLGLFLSQTKVLPGIPASLTMPAGTGSTTGPGQLLPPPAGGPNKAAILALATTALRGAGLEGAALPMLAEALAGICEQGLIMFCAQVQVAPGIPVSGLVTSAPGRLS